MATEVVGSVKDDKKVEAVVGVKPVLIPEGTLRMSGKAGKPYNIDGQGFGDGSGSSSVAVSGRLIPFTRWVDHSIKGLLPPDLKSGEVIVRTNEGKEIRGKFEG